MDRGGKGATVGEESVEEKRGTFSEIGSGDGNLLVGGEGAEMGRGLYQPCSARNFARISKARWRAASSSSGLDGGGGGGAGFDGLGA